MAWVVLGPIVLGLLSVLILDLSAGMGCSGFRSLGTFSRTCIVFCFFHFYIFIHAFHNGHVFSVFFMCFHCVFIDFSVFHYFSCCF